MYDEIEGFVLPFFIMLGGAVVIGGAGLVVATVDGIVGGITSASSDLKTDTVVIEENIETLACFEEFNLKAYGVSKKEDHYYAEIFGEAVIAEGADPVYTSLTYEIDKTLYSDMKSAFKIEYSLEADNSISNITYSHGNFFFYSSYVAEKKDIVKQLTEVTKQQIVEKRIFTNSKEIVDLAIEKMGTETQVKALGAVRIDEINGIAWFNLDIAIKTDNNTIELKRLVITTPLTHEIVEDPTKAYTFYANNPDKCTIDLIENGKSVIFQGTNKNGQRALGVLDDEPIK